MPKFNAKVATASSGERTPGRWLAEIKPSFTLKSGAKSGVEVGTSKNGAHEQWKIGLTIVDEHPEAPTGTTILDRLTWDAGAAESRIYALLRAMGHPIDEWRKETDPAKAREIKPDDLYNRPIVIDCVPNEQGFLGLRGFAPFYAASSARGPAPATPPASPAAKPGAQASSGGERQGGLPF